MKELKDICKAYDEAIIQNKKAALLTVVNVEGSSYRRPGARMLVTEDGKITGAISGGCLEGDALRKAQLVIRQQENKLVTYDSMDEDDLKFGVQLGCNGIVSILFEPIDANSENNPICLLKKVSSQRSDAMLLTVFGKEKASSHKGTCACIVNGAAFGVLDDSNIWNDARMHFNRKTSIVNEYRNANVLYQFLPPVTQLVIAGAGNDATPLVEMAAIQGWEIVIADGRASYATRERFPKASNILVKKSREVLDELTIDEDTAIVLMTHNYNYDIDLLRQLVGEKAGYIGVLGPKKKMQRMLDELSAKGVKICEEQLARIHGPVGLDIGAEAAEEIAVSVVAEIMACRRHRDGAPLKYREGSIYARA